MKRVFFVILILTAFSGLFSAPLEKDFSLAPVYASLDEKTKTFTEARFKVIDAAKSYENTPYRYGGVSYNGLDCSGLIYLSFKDALGVSLPRTSSELYEWSEKIPRGKAQPGDLLFFKTDNTGAISHVAIYLGDGSFIHSASSGPQTGVIYSTLDEKYWGRNFAGAGRALPETDAAYMQSHIELANSPNAGNAAAKSTFNSRLLVGAAFAPTWSAFMTDNGVFRGFASQLRLTTETKLFNKEMVFGLEVRPEYDGALGVFRLPVTLSWGQSDKFMVFAGPVFSFGDPSFSFESGDRQYIGGTTWFGAVGITAAPFKIKTSGGEFAPYIEAAWQSYISSNSEKNTSADFAASFRFSSGLRWSLQIK